MSMFLQNYLERASQRRDAELEAERVVAEVKAADNAAAAEKGEKIVVSSSDTITSSNVQEPTLPAHVKALQAIIANPATKDKEFATLLQGCVIPELKPHFTALRSDQLRESTMAAHVLLTNHLDSVLQLQKHQESILAIARKDITEGANARKRAADVERALSDAQKIIKAREVELKSAQDVAVVLQGERDAEKKRLEEEQVKVVELEKQVNAEREKSVELLRRVEKGEGNFAELKKGIPGLITKVLGSSLVANPYNDYVDAVRTHAIADVTDAL
ncbi:uncharacterized protein [Rutidosis leptorrhynchoides]|uniref:uncharacterized protein n=1 Tax=Rutidosis leptorrhynchoides TaxID=125765 RepID=UPI003A99022A